MRKCRNRAPLILWASVMLCAFSAAAWAGPIDIPVPGASTAAAPPPAYGAPGASTSSAPAAATASSKPAAAVPPGANPPPPGAPPLPKPKGPDYSHVDVSALLVQSFGDQDVGHGQRVALSYAVSDGAFFVLDGARHDRSGQVQRNFDVGVGLDTTDNPSRSFYAIIDWTGIGMQPTAAGSGGSGHGYALSGGVRVFPLQSVELYAQARYDNNPVLDGHTSGEIGLLYNFTHSLWLGLSLATNSQENDYFISLRWDY